MKSEMQILHFYLVEQITNHEGGGANANDSLKFVPATETVIESQSQPNVYNAVKLCDFM